MATIVTGNIQGLQCGCENEVYLLFANPFFAYSFFFFVENNLHDVISRASPRR